MHSKRMQHSDNINQLTIDLEKIKRKIIEGNQLEAAIQNLNWKEFETFIAEIFRSNGYRVKQNFRFKTKERYEIDLVATNGRYVLCIDCKEWGQRRNKKYGLRSAVAKQEKRTVELKKFLKKNPIAVSMLGLSTKHNFYPLIVTLLEEGLLKENKTIVVPAWKLNGFLLDMENYLQ